MDKNSFRLTKLIQVLLVCCAIFMPCEHLWKAVAFSSGGKNKLHAFENGQQKHLKKKKRLFLSNELKPENIQMKVPSHYLNGLHIVLSLTQH